MSAHDEDTTELLLRAAVRVHGAVQITRQGPRRFVVTAPTEGFLDGPFGEGATVTEAVSALLAKWLDQHEARA